MIAVSQNQKTEDKWDASIDSTYRCNFQLVSLGYSAEDEPYDE